MKHQCINGWTKERMIQRIQEVFGEDLGRCYYQASCRYRLKVKSAGKADRCAVGAFIPDDWEHLDVVVETNEGPHTMLSDFGADNCTWMPMGPNALEAFQKVHDSSRGPVGPILIKWIQENVED